MKLSVVIPAFNEEKLLPATLAAVDGALAVFRARRWDTEVIVCDNNSTDRTPEIARQHGARVVFEPVNQISRARNAGAAAATGDWLLFVDADSRPSPDLMADLADALASGECFAVGSTVALDGAGPSARAVCGLWNWLSVWRRLLAGSFIACDAALFRRVGGFSLELFASEEIDLSRRLKEFTAGQGRSLRILTRHPLATSGRKLHLYSRWDYAKFLARVVAGFGRPLRSRAACQPWYDGRR